MVHGRIMDKLGQHLLFGETITSVLLSVQNVVKHFIGRKNMTNILTDILGGVRLPLNI